MGRGTSGSSKKTAEERASSGTAGGALRREAIARYLRERLGELELCDLYPLGEMREIAIKGYGYGRPLCATFRREGKLERVVLRTMTPDPFGHDRRADRVAEMALAYDTFGHMPEHVRPLDMGVIDPGSGELRSMPGGEPFLLTEYVEGHLYAADLQDLRNTPTASALDLARADRLAQVLVALHTEPAPPASYDRALRDLVGSGEGVFGLCDAYAPNDAVAPPARLEALEGEVVRWRWKLRKHRQRARRTHGDFHPFNIVFREDVDLSLLDCSRGGAGDPADDVCCLSINYLFFSLVALGHFASGPYRALWDRFWLRYLKATGDEQLTEVVAPFFAWRALVLACPLWYPTIRPGVRDQLLRWAERLLAGWRFSPSEVEGALA